MSTRVCLRAGSELSVVAGVPHSLIVGSVLGLPSVFSPHSSISNDGRTPAFADPVGAVSLRFTRVSIHKL